MDSIISYRLLLAPLIPMAAALLIMASAKRPNLREGFSAVGALLTFVTGRVASYLAADPPVVKKWGWAGLVSQAGLALGLSGTVARTFPAFGDGFRALAIAAVAINEFFGPIFFKLALDRAGETSSLPARKRPSLMPTGNATR